MTYFQLRDEVAEGSKRKDFEKESNKWKLIENQISRFSIWNDIGFFFRKNHMVETTFKKFEKTNFSTIEKIDEQN